MKPDRHPSMDGTGRQGSSGGITRGWHPMLVMACALFWITAAGVARAEDVVHLTAEGDPIGRFAARGEILDFTGEAIIIGREGMPPRRYPAARVLDIETTWNDACLAGREAMAKREFAAAARQLTEANRAERRVWARRRILADLMRCYEALGQPESAADVFLAIVESDPTTPALADAPLAWFPESRLSRGKAESWLAMQDQPATVLLGASYLLSTSGAAAARQALERLQGNDDTRIATLAEAQLWRRDVMRATLGDAERWTHRIEEMDEELRAGPYFVLGQACERLDMSDAAALAYLRVPVLFPRRRELAARALIAAGRIAYRAGHSDEALLAWTEVVDRYSDTPPAAEARQLLDSMP